MNQNLQYTYSSDPRSSGNQNQQIQGISFHQNSYQPTNYNNSTSGAFHSSSSAAFIPNSVTQTPQRRMGEEKNLVNMLDAYFIDSTTPSTSSTSWNQQPVQMSSLQQSVSTYSQQIPQQIKSMDVDNMSVKLGSSPDKSEKERAKKARQAEAARMRYHRLSNEEKRELNLKRTLAQKRKRQREKEMEELESILRETNDIQEDPDITEQLREKRMRAKWAEAARTRYARMTPEERRAHNTRRRMRQMQNAMSAIKKAGFQASGMATGDPVKDDEAVRQHIKTQNAKKAEAARQRYHRMNDEEKRVYNQRRTEAFRRRRMEEEMLLAMPIGRINGEALDRAQQIVVRNAKRAEAARLRYQRMTPDQRKIAKQEPKDDSWLDSPTEQLDDLEDSYNQKRYTPKRRRNDLEDMMAAGQMAVGSSGTIAMGSGTAAKKDDMDALSTLERDVVKRTQHAQQILLRQRANQPSTPRSVTPPPQTYIIQSSNGQQQQQHLGGQQLNLAGGSGSNGIQQHQVIHGHMGQQGQGIQVSHQVLQQSSNSIPQNIYTGGMLMNQNQQAQQQGQQGQQQQQQILNNPYNRA